VRVIRHTGRARAALGLAACVSAAGLAVVVAPPAVTAASVATVPVVLDEWKLVPARTSVRARRVTFVVQNHGGMTHEFVVVRGDGRTARLAVKAGKAVETGRRGRIAQIGSGASKRLTLTLQPGKYVLLCNLLGHYQAGQSAVLVVR